MPGSPVRKKLKVSPKSPREKSDLELKREKNIRERDEYIKHLVNSDPEFAEVMKDLCIGSKSKHKLTVRRGTRNNNDPSFRCSGRFIPLEIRKSARLQNRAPDTNDVDTATNKRKISDDDYDYQDLEEIVYEPKISRNSGNNRSSVHHIIPVEEIEEKMIASIAKATSKKIYSQLGTSCHQCRQKTMDQKTCCRNVDCIGVRGQFCGICLFNRYGERAAEALRDPNWHCPVCRKICNCSFCRAKAGKRPTGILTPLAHQAGHKSVKDFLDSLKGEGDYPDQDNLPRENEEPNDFLGFSSDGTATYTDGVQHGFEAPLNLEKLQEICKKKENELSLLEDGHDECQNLLGFYTDSNTCLLENNTEYKLTAPSYSAAVPIEDLDEDNKTDVDSDVDLAEQENLKMEMNSELLQETQATAASG